MFNVRIYRVLVPGGRRSISLPGRLLPMIFVFCASFLPGLDASAATRIQLLLSDASPHYQAVAEGVAEYLHEHHPAVEVVHGLAGGSPTQSPDLLVTIGTAATASALAEDTQQPQLALFITQSTWRNLHNGQMPSKAALLMDQPPWRYLTLARLLVPDASTVSAVLGPVSQRQRKALQASATRLKLNLKLADFDRNSNPLQVLTPLFQGTDAFIALPEQGVVNRNIAQWTLHLGFKRKVPVIGFSRAYTQAGAAASVFTAPEDVARQAGDWLEQFLAGNRDGLWQAYPPHYASVAVNPSVSRVLGLSHQGEREIRARLNSQTRGVVEP